MKRHVIIGDFGKEDVSGYPTSEDDVLTRLELAIGGQQLDHGVGRALKDLAKLGVYPNEIGIDLLVLAAHVHAADTRVSRASESQDGWTRELRIVVPVDDPDRWMSAKAMLSRMLNFLTGDRWDISFRTRPDQFKQLSKEVPQLIGPSFDTLALFSGGLDSLINAIDMLEAGRSPLFISHAGEGATSDAQSTLFDALKERYPERTFDRLRLWMTFPEGFVPEVAVENTTRGRSFLFFALAVFAASGFDEQRTLFVPENGLIALNVPLDPLRLGALSTRTTHPFYIARWNDLTALLDIPCRIENPYWARTKGEMADNCSNRELLQRLLSSSISCSSPSKGRWQGLPTQQCGYCLPCLIRRAAIEASFGKGSDPTHYTLANLLEKPLEAKQAEGQQIRSFQLAIDRLRARPDLAAILIHKPGPLSDEQYARHVDLASVYERGLEEVGVLLTGVETSSE